MQVVMRAAFGFALAAGLFIQSPAMAQSDTRGLTDRLDRLERDINTLQSQVYRNSNASGTTVINSPALGGGITSSGSGTGGSGAGGSGNLNGNAYSMLDDRIGQLENQLRDLTGQVEKANYAANQLSSKLDRMQQDNDFRFKALEEKAGIGPAVTAPAGGAPAPGAAAPGKPDQPPAGGNQGPGAPAGNLIHGNNGNGAPTAITPGASPASAAAPTALPGKTPGEQFDYAFGLLKNADNAGAAKAFQAFVAAHPQDPLAGNATYWLGQIAFSQAQYDQAAVTFLDVYRKYPKSAKAGESLLKVGISMGNLGKKKEACAALGRFTAEYPEAADNLRRMAAAEKQKQGC